MFRSLLRTLPARQSRTDEARTAVFRKHPGAVLPWRLMTNVARVAAGEIGYPVTLFILMKTNNRLLRMFIFAPLTQVNDTLLKEDSCPLDFGLHRPPG